MWIPNRVFRGKEQSGNGLPDGIARFSHKKGYAKIVNILCKFIFMHKERTQLKETSYKNADLA